MTANLRDALLEALAAPMPSGKTVRITADFSDSGDIRIEAALGTSRPTRLDDGCRGWLVEDVIFQCFRAEGGDMAWQETGRNHYVIAEREQ